MHDTKDNLKITFLLAYAPNPRMRKRINVALDFTDKVSLIQWDKQQDKMENYTNPAVDIHIIELKAAEKPIQRIPQYLKFSKLARKSLEALKPNIIHLQGLDMLKIAVDYKKNFDEKVKIVYEVADVHRYLTTESKNIIKQAIKRTLINIEENCSDYVDKLIITSPKYYELYFHRFYTKEETLVFENYPDLSVFKGFQARNFYKEPLNVSYIGGIRYKEQIRILLDVAKELPITVELAGYEDGEPEIENLAKTMPNVKWHGKYDYKQDIKGLYEDADVVFSVYDADLYNVRIALPNKYYESIYCQKPIIVAKNTYLEERVSSLNVGLAVDCHSKTELKQALLFLMDKDNYQEITHNCLEAKTKIKDGNYKKDLGQLYLDLSHDYFTD